MDPQKLTKAQKRELRKMEWAKEAQKAKQANQYKKIGIWIGVAVVIFVSIFGLAMLVNSSPSSNSNTSQSSLTVPVKASQEFSRGDANSKVTLIEYGDFQCPACAQAEPLVSQILSDEGNKLHFVYRYFPLTNVHQNAHISAQAGFAANKQGKFWEMSGKLYENQSEWANSTNPQDNFLGFAKDLGMNTQQFKNDMNSAEASKFVDDSLNAAIKLGLNSTPSFFLNGNLINFTGYDNFKKQIDAAFQKNESSKK